MSEARADKTAAVFSEHVEAGDFAHANDASGAVAGTGKTDAVNSGIVRTSDRARDAMKRGAPSLAGVARAVRRQSDDGSPEGDFGDESAEDIAYTAGYARQGAARAKSLRENAARAGGETPASATGENGQAQTEAPSAKAGRAGTAHEAKRTPAPSGKGKADAPAGTTRRGKAGFGKQASRKADAAKKKLQSRRTWLKAREANAAASTTKAAATAGKKGVAKAIAAAASSAAAPLAGVLAGVVCFVLVVLMISQLASALFGFWENEAMKSTGTLTGVEAEIAQELKGYGFSNEAIAAILGNLKAESGMDPAADSVMDGQFNYAYERACGIFQYTSTAPGTGEYWAFKTWCSGNGKPWSDVKSQMEWTFSGHCDGTWSSRWSTGLARSGYYSNCPGYTDGAYYEASEFKEADDVDKATFSWMACYERPANGQYAHLDRRIEYAREYYAALSAAGSADGNAIVAAARSQLGVPYVWRGSTPGVGLDCSGLTQYCYAQSGIQIPRYSEDQASSGTKVPLSEAKPGDILWRPGHVAIFIGGDQYIHEPQTGDVCKISTGISYFTCAVRY